VSSGTRIIAEIEDGETCEFTAIAQPDGPTIADLFRQHELPLNTRCGQRGLCRGCEILLQEGTLATGREIVSAPATVKACDARIKEGGRVVVRIPPRSRIEHRPQVAETFSIDIPCAHQPLFEVSGERDTAFAVDVGTTTMAVLLIDIATGNVLSRAGGFNGQIRFGDNVLTRIDVARSREVLIEMQRAAVAGTVAPLLVRACERAGRRLSRLAGGTIAGNTTMLHILCGEDPTPLGIAPFTARFLEGKRLKASDIGLAAGVDGGVLASDTPLQLLPGISAYIGADITAGVWATGMVFDNAPSLLVDIGTNGEIVLQSGGDLTACATAAGPAFEGSGLRSGTRARDGAVCEIDMGLDPFRITAERIGGKPVAGVTGICGSAYIDFLSTGRKCGLLLESGRFDPAAWQKIPADLRIEEDGERALRISGRNGLESTCISEVDIAVLLQAKAAIGAGIEILLDTAGIDASRISRLYLAGGFGMHMNVSHAIAMGLLPGFRKEQVRVVGNTALAGALLALLDRTTLDEMEGLRPRVDVLELNLQEDFEDRYVDHLALP